MEHVNWEALAHKLGVNSPDSTMASYSSEMAPIALDHILGATFIEETVNYCLDLRPGWGIAEEVLTRLQSPTAVQYCHAIYTSTDGDSRRVAAARLLSKIGTHQSNSYISQFLNDQKPGVQQAGMRLLRRWVDYNMDDRAMLKQLTQAEQHASPEVREEAQRLRAFIAYTTTFDEQYKAKK